MAIVAESDTRADLVDYVVRIPSEDETSSPCWPCCRASSCPTGAASGSGLESGHAAVERPQARPGLEHALPARHALTSQMAPGAGLRVAMVGPLHVDLFVRGSHRSSATRSTPGSALRRSTCPWRGRSAMRRWRSRASGGRSSFTARLGSDAFGDHIAATLSGRGIDTRFVRRADGQTAMAIYALLFGSPKRPMTYRLASFEPWLDARRGPSW